MTEAKKTTKKAVKESVATPDTGEVTKATQESAEQPEVIAKPAVTKAGKHSAKALKEAEEKEAKEARKTAANEGDEQPKLRKPVKPTRTRLERRAKNYRKLAEQIEKGKEYDLKEALQLAQKTSTTKFDASVELHVRLGVDPKHADQNIRGSVVLPAGSGKQVRVAVFGDIEDVKKAKAAGADIAAADEFLQDLDKEKVDFDILIATPKMMPKLGKYARLLGPKGLMPNPKSGTVTSDVTKAVKEAKGGKVEYRVDPNGIVHSAFGKVSFSSSQLLDNATTLIQSIKAAKPASVKGNYVLSAYITTTMGPSVRISIS